MARLPIWSYLAVTVPLVLTPGASTAVVLRNSLTGGISGGIATAIGTNVGSLCYGLLSAFGLALALRRWPSAWEVLRIGGAAYLAWLGVRSIRRAFDAVPVTPAASVDDRPRSQLAQAREGFLSNALNPAIATFYLVILPQFIPADAPAVRSALILTAVHVSLAWSWHMTWAAAGGTLARSLTGGIARRGARRLCRHRAPRPGHRDDLSRSQVAGRRSQVAGRRSRVAVAGRERRGSQVARSRVARRESQVARRRSQSQVAGRTSQVARRGSQVAGRRSRVARRGRRSHVAGRRSQVAGRTSRVAGRTSHVARRTSHVARRTSHVARRRSHVARRSRTSQVARRTC